MNKRRASHVDSPDFSTPDATKRIRKRNDDTYFPDVESAATTKDAGLKFISLLRKSTDKNGRLIADAFLTLPDRDGYPDYYEQIALPLSIELVEQRLEDGHYTSMTDLEQDLKRMVQNAKDYNDSKSVIYEDAERIRKSLSNFMPKYNPAYSDTKFRAVPTPIPDHVRQSNGHVHSSPAPSGSARSSRPRSLSASGSEPAIKLKFARASSNRQSSTSTPAPTKQEEDLEDTFLQLLDDLSGQDNAINFEERVRKRDVPDYYKIIQRPTSINDVRKGVRQGDVVTWEDLAREVRLIWSNAKEYNEPGSEIYSMTEGLESWFEQQLQSHGVPPKIIPSLKLSVSKPQPNLKLKIAAPAEPTNGTIHVDKAALDRQNAAMARAMEDAMQASGRPPNLKKASSTGPQSTTLATPISTSSIPADVPTPAIEVPAPSHPSSIPNGYHHLPVFPLARSTSRPPTAPTQTPLILSPLDRKLRPAQKAVSSAILQSVTYTTNPNLSSDPHWSLTRHASASKTQTAYSIYLPRTHASLRIIPVLHPDLTSKQRKHKLFVVSNNLVVPPNSSASDAGRGAGVFDCILKEGENTLVVEVLADLDEAEKQGVPPNVAFEYEKITFYVYIRSWEAVS